MKGKPYLKYGVQYEDGANKDEDVAERVGVFDISCPGSPRKNCSVRAYTVPYDNPKDSIFLELLSRREFTLNVEILTAKEAKQLERDEEIPIGLFGNIIKEVGL